LSHHSACKNGYDRLGNTWEVRLLKRLAAAALLALALTCSGLANAQTVPPDAMAAARELVVTMRSAEQIKAILPTIMQQLKPAIVKGGREVERDFEWVLPIMIESVAANSAALAEGLALRAQLYARRDAAAYRILSGPRRAEVSRETAIDHAGMPDGRPELCCGGGE